MVTTRRIRQSIPGETPAWAYVNHNVVISTLPREQEMSQTEVNGCRTSPTITRAQQLPRMRARVGFASATRGIRSLGSCLNG